MKYSAAKWADRAREADGWADAPAYFAILDLADRLGVKSEWMTKIDEGCTVALLGEEICRELVYAMYGEASDTAQNWNTDFGTVPGLSLRDRDRIVSVLPGNWFTADYDITKIPALVDVRLERCTLMALHATYTVRARVAGEKVVLDSVNGPATHAMTEDQTVTATIPKALVRVPSAETDGPVMKITHNFTNRRVMVRRIRGGELLPIDYYIETGEALALNLRDLVYRHTITTTDPAPPEAQKEAEEDPQEATA